MKKYLVFSFVLFAFAACQNEPGDSSGNAAVAGRQNTAAPEPAASSVAAAEAATPKTEQDAAAEPALGARPAYSPPQSEDRLTIMAGSMSARPGATACVPIRVKGFTNLLAMQYTMAWDPAVLEFAGLNKLGLPYLDQADFGYNRVKEGLLPFVWINDALQPTTIPDESVVYEVCFTAIGQAGQSTAIRLVQQPTPFEVVNGNEEVVQLQPVEGKVVLKE